MFKRTRPTKFAHNKLQCREMRRDGKGGGGRTSVWMLSIFKEQGRNFTKRRTFPFDNFEGIILSSFIESGTTKHLFSSISQNCWIASFASSVARSLSSLVPASLGKAEAILSL